MSGTLNQPAVCTVSYSCLTDVLCWVCCLFTCCIRVAILCADAGEEGSETLASAVTAVRQLKAQRIGGKPAGNKLDSSTLSHAVSLAVKAASRLRKAILDAAYLQCSDSVAAMLADSLEAAAGLVESAGGLKSAAGASPRS